MCISLTMNYITKIYLLTCNVSLSCINYLLGMKMLAVTIFESAGVQASADPKGSLLVPERLMLPLPHHPHPGHCPRHNTPRCAPASGHPSGSACNQGFTCKNTFFLIYTYQNKIKIYLGVNLMIGYRKSAKKARRPMTLQLFCSLLTTVSKY